MKQRLVMCKLAATPNLGEAVWADLTSEGIESSAALPGNLAAALEGGRIISHSSMMHGMPGAVLLSFVVEFDD